MKDHLPQDGAEDLGLHPGVPGRQRQVLGPRRPGMEPKAQQQSRVSVLLVLSLKVQLWIGSCRPEYLFTSQDLGRLDVFPLLVSGEQHPQNTA